MFTSAATDLRPLSEFEIKKEAKMSAEEQSDHPALQQSDMVGNIEKDNQDNIVDFAENDEENPVNWSGRRKWPIVAIVALMSMISVFATTTIVPAAPKVIEAFHIDNNIYQTLLVSIWELGECVGPFFIGPLTEKYGRLPIYHAGNLIGVLCAVAAALSTNISMLIAFRFLNGAFLTALTLSPVIIGDLFRPEERGAAIAIGGGFLLLGPFIAPIVGGFITESLGWRWTLWLNVIVIGAFGLLSVPILRETYAVKILERRAARLRKETGNPRLQSKFQARVDASSVLQHMTRPIQTLFLSPTVALISFYTAFAYALSYIILTTLTSILEDNYGFGQGIVGLAFLASSLGNVAGIIAYGTTSDKYAAYKAKRSSDGKIKPEDRLIHMVIGACVLPLGFLLYGWTLAFHVHWMAPLVGSALVGFSTMLAILPTENYLVDTFELHSASALAAGVILRAVFGAAIPLIGPPIYQSLGLGWGNSVLALMSAVFIPPLILLVRWGNWLRRKEKLAAPGPNEKA